MQLGLTETPIVFHYENKWKYDDQGIENYPGTLSFKKYDLPDCRILTEGKYYKIVLKTYFDDDAYIHSEGWVSSYKYIYISSSNIYYDNSSYNNNIAHSEVAIVGETISGNVVVKAKNYIKIYPGTHISANFNAIIDSSLPVVCNAIKSAKIDTLNISELSTISDNTNNISYDIPDHFNYKSNEVSVIKDLSITEESNISIYPNPNNGSFTILLKNDAVTEISVINMFGQEVCYNIDKTSDSSLAISLSDSSDGVYLVKLKGKQKTYVRKIIVKK